MEYEFNYVLVENHKKVATRSSIRLSHAPLLLDVTLVKIAHVLEQQGRIQGQQFRIRSIEIRSDYQPTEAAPRLIAL